MMMHTMGPTLSRRGWLSRLVLAAAVAPVVGATRIDTGEAKKKSKKLSKKQRVEQYRRACEAGGGTADVV